MSAYGKTISHAVYALKTSKEIKDTEKMEEETSRQTTRASRE